MHLIIYFGDSAAERPTLDINGALFCDVPNVQLIAVAGSIHPDVCNSILSPDLRSYAKRFAKNVFIPREVNRLRLTETPIVDLKIGASFVQKDNAQGQTDSDEITGITLCGSSRGAVTCFEVARELKKIAPIIPVDVIAAEPVPGNCYQYPGSNAARVTDCSDLTNLQHVSIILGANTGDDESQSGFLRRIMVIFHRLFFSQIVPKLPKTTDQDIVVIPEKFICQEVGEMHWILN